MSDLSDSVGDHLKGQGDLITFEQFSLCLLRRLSKILHPIY